MSALRKFYQQSSHYLAGRLAVMVLGFISFPIFTRIFTLSEYGIINLVAQVILVLTAFSKLGLQNAVQRFYPDYASSPDPREFRRYYATLFWGAAAVAALVTVLYLVVVWALPQSTVSSYAKAALFISSAMILLRSLRMMQANLLQIEGRSKLFNGLEIVSKIVTVGCTCALVFAWRRTVIAFFLGNIIGESILLFGVCAWLLRRHLMSPRDFDPKFLRSALAFSVPLMSGEIAWIVLDSSDRFLVQRYLGFEAVGLYSAAYGIANYVQDLVWVPITLALFPVCVELWSKKGKEATRQFLCRSLDHFALAAIGIIAVFIVTSHDMVIVLASQKYQSADNLLPVLVCGLVVSAVSLFLKPILLLYKKVNSFFRATLYAGVLNIALNLILLPYIGLMGAAVATLVSYVGWVYWLGRESQRLMPLQINGRRLLQALAAAAITMLVVSQIRFTVPIIELAVRGTLASCGYAALTLALSKALREDARRLLQTITREPEAAKTYSADETVHAVQP